MQEIINHILNYSYIIRFIIAILLFFSLRYLLKKALKKILTKLRKKEDKSSAVFLSQFLKRFDVFAILIWLTVLDELSFNKKYKQYWENVEMALLIAITFYVGMFFINITNKIKQRLLHKNKDHTMVNIITKISQTTVVIITLIIILHMIGVHISAILAFSSAGGLVVGFAAKDLLSNIFGGFMIYIDKPFKIGDWIRSPDKEIEGTVKNIGWRQTQIMTFANRPLYIPNSIFANIVVENPSRMTHRRIKENIGIRYIDVSKMAKITQDVIQMLENHDEIDNKEVMMVNFNRFADSSLEFFIYTYTKTTQWEKYHEIKHGILLKVSEIITKNKAEIAFPTFTSHVKIDKKDKTLF